MKKNPLLFMVALGLMLTQAATGKDGNHVKIVDLGKADVANVPFQTYQNETFMTSTSGPIQAASTNKFASIDKKLTGDVSAYKKVTLKLSDWPVDEVMFILEGSVEITDLDGHGQIYKAGDAFVMPKGFSGTWRQLSDIKKVSFSYSPK